MLHTIFALLTLLTAAWAAQTHTIGYTEDFCRRSISIEISGFLFTLVPTGRSQRDVITLELAHHRYLPWQATFSDKNNRVFRTDIIPSIETHGPGHQVKRFRVRNVNYNGYFTMELEYYMGEERTLVFVELDVACIRGKHLLIGIGFA